MAMMCEDNEWGQKSEWYENVDIWGKKLTFVHHTNNDGLDDITIHGCNHGCKGKCPKCETLFNPYPSHRSFLKCVRCGGEYWFLGALNPQPVNKTREEVEKALGWR
jgi:hypothetical protein